MNLKEILKDIPSSFRKNGYCIVIGVFVRALLNFVGIAALLSMLLLLLANDRYQQHIWIIALGGLLFLVFKNIVVMMIERRESKYLLSLYQYYSATLLETYYKRGLLSIKATGVSTLTHEVNQVCYSFVTNVLTPILRMAGESLLLVMIIIALLIYAPLVVVLILSLFIPIALSYMYIIRKKIEHYGKAENSAKHKQWKTVEDTFRGYVEIEINQAYKILHAKFKEELKHISFNRIQTETLQKIPRALIEIGMAAALLLLILFFNSTEELKVILGVFAIAAFRILPGLTALISGWTQVKNNYYTVDVISAIKESVTEDKQGETSIQFSDELKVENLSFTYPDDSDYVINDLSFTIKRGELVGIQGVSGSGKSTLFNLLQGFFKAQKGVIKIDGVLLSSENCKAWQKSIGYVPQEVFIMNGTIAENIALGQIGEGIDYDRLNSVLESVQLKHWVEGLPNGVDYALSGYGNNISGGEKQRIGIARALYKGAKTVFLDEATSALDNYTEKEILAVIKELSRENDDLTLIMIAHRDSSLSICERVIKIK